MANIWLTRLKSKWNKLNARNRINEFAPSFQLPDYDAFAFETIERNFAFLIHEYGFRIKRYYGPVGKGNIGIIYELQDRNMDLAIGLEADDMGITIQNAELGHKDIADVFSDLEGCDMREWLYADSLKGNFSKNLTWPDYMTWQVRSVAQKFESYMPKLMSHLYSLSKA